MHEDFIQKMFLENRSCAEIQNELKVQFGEHAYKQSTIYKHLKRLRLGLPQVEQRSPGENCYDEQLLITIQQ